MGNVRSRVATGWFGWCEVTAWSCEYLLALVKPQTLHLPVVTLGDLAVMLSECRCWPAAASDPVLGWRES